MRRLLRVLSRILLGSVVATRTGAAPVPSYEIEAKVRDDWRKARHETLRGTLLIDLPDEVRQFLPEESDWSLDLPTAIRLSYAAARPSDFRALDDYWSRHPEVASNQAASEAFEETRHWLAGKDGMIERAEPRRSTEIALSGVAGPTAEFISPFDFVWRVQERDDDDGDDDDNDDDDGDDDDGGYDG